MLAQFQARFTYSSGYGPDGRKIVVIGRQMFYALAEVESWRQAMEDSVDDFRFTVHYPTARGVRSLRRQDGDGLS